MLVSPTLRRKWTVDTTWSRSQYPSLVSCILLLFSVHRPSLWFSRLSQAGFFGIRAHRRLPLNSLQPPNPNVLKCKCLAKSTSAHHRASDRLYPALVAHSAVDWNLPTLIRPSCRKSRLMSLSQMIHHYSTETCRADTCK